MGVGRGLAAVFRNSPYARTGSSRCACRAAPCEQHGARAAAVHPARQRHRRGGRVQAQARAAIRPTANDSAHTPRRPPPARRPASSGRGGRGRRPGAAGIGVRHCDEGTGEGRRHDPGEERGAATTRAGRAGSRCPPRTAAPPLSAAKPPLDARPAAARLPAPPPEQRGQRPDGDRRTGATGAAWTRARGPPSPAGPLPLARPRRSRPPRPASPRSAIIAATRPLPPSLSGSGAARRRRAGTISSGAARCSASPASRARGRRTRRPSGPYGGPGRRPRHRHQAEEQRGDVQREGGAAGPGPDGRGPRSHIAGRAAARPKQMGDPDGPASSRRRSQEARRLGGEGARGRGRGTGVAGGCGGGAGRAGRSWQATRPPRAAASGRTPRGGQGCVQVRGRGPVCRPVDRPWCGGGRPCGGVRIGCGVGRWRRVALRQSVSQPARQGDGRSAREGAPGSPGGRVTV